jgi:hypothetical protein
MNDLFNSVCYGCLQSQPRWRQRREFWTDFIKPFMLARDKLVRFTPENISRLDEPRSLAS